MTIKRIATAARKKAAAAIKREARRQARSIKRQAIEFIGLPKQKKNGVQNDQHDRD